MSTPYATLAYNPLKDSDRLPVLVRLASSPDSALVYSTWMRSYADQNKDQHRGILYKSHRKIIRNLMEKSVTVMAVMDDDPNQIFAWMCGIRTKTGPLLVHYCYVKDAFRRLGLAKLLLGYFEHRSGEPIICSHKGYVYKSLRDRYNLFYVPQVQEPTGVDKFEDGKWKL